MKRWNTIRIELDSSKNEIRRYTWRKCQVDTKGNPIEEFEFDYEGNIICKRFYRYFENETIKEYIEYDALDGLVERHYYTVNEDGEIDKVEFEYEEGLKVIKDYRATDLGNAYKAVIKNENGELSGYEVYKQDEYGRDVEEIELDEDHNELIKFEKSYSDNGDLLIEKEYRDGTLFQGQKFEYDLNGNLSKTTLRNYIDNYEVVELNMYDKNNNVICASSHQNGVLVYENQMTYDEHNRLLKEEIFQKDFWNGSILMNETLVHEWIN